MSERLIMEMIEIIYLSLDLLCLHYFCALFLRKRVFNFFTNGFIILLALVTLYWFRPFTLLIFLLYVFLMFEEKPKKMLLTSFTFIVMYTLIVLLLPVETFDPLIQTTLQLVMRLMLFGVGLLVQRVFRIQTQEFLNLRSLLILTVLSLLVVNLMFDQIYLRTTIRLYQLVLLMSMVFMVSASLIAFLVYHLVQTRQVSQQAKSRLHEMTLKNEAYIQNMNQQVELLNVKHDLKNHLITLNSFIEQDQKQEALSYLKSLSVHPGLITYVHTHNDVLNAILNQKITQYRDIHFKVNHDDGLYEIPSEQLTIILGNALDNAIEAVNLLDIDKKVIKVVLSENETHLKMLVSNPILERPLFVDGQMVSTKVKEHSGLGLNNMKSALKKIGGILEISVSDNRFDLIILIEKEDTRL